MQIEERLSQNTQYPTLKLNGNKALVKKPDRRGLECQNLNKRIDICEAHHTVLVAIRLRKEIARHFISITILR